MTALKGRDRAFSTCLEQSALISGGALGGWGFPECCGMEPVKEPEKLKVFDFQPGTDYTHKADGLEGIHNIHLGSDGMHSSDPDS